VVPPPLLYILFANHLIVIWLVSDAKAADREDLFIRKLRQCSQVFDFTDPLGDLKACHRMHPIISISHGICSVSVVEGDQAGSTD
jgi:hypothetical protein